MMLAGHVTNWVLSISRAWLHVIFIAVILESVVEVCVHLLVFLLLWCMWQQLAHVREVLHASQQALHALPAHVSRHNNMQPYWLFMPTLYCVELAG